MWHTLLHHYAGHPVLQRIKQKFSERYTSFKLLLFHRKKLFKHKEPPKFCNRSCLTNLLCNAVVLTHFIITNWSISDTVTADRGVGTESSFHQENLMECMLWLSRCYIQTCWLMWHIAKPFLVQPINTWSMDQPWSLAWGMGITGLMYSSARTLKKCLCLQQSKCNKATKFHKSHKLRITYFSYHTVVSKTLAAKHKIKNKWVTFPFQWSC